MCQMDITHHALCLVPISKHISWGRSYIFPRKSFLWVNRGPGTLKLWKTVKLLLSQPFCWLPFNKIQKSLQPRQDFNLHPHIYMYMVLYQLSLWSWSFVRENHILPKAENVSGESQLFVFSISYGHKFLPLVKTFLVKALLYCQYRKNRQTWYLSKNFATGVWRTKNHDNSKFCTIQEGCSKAEKVKSGRPRNVNASEFYLKINYLFW